MSLPEAMLDLAQEMEDTAAAGGHIDPEVASQWSKQIRRMVKASATDAPKQQPYNVQSDLAARFASPQDVQLAQRAATRLHERMTREQDLDTLEDVLQPKLVPCVDGPEQGLFVNVDPTTAYGQKVSVGGITYEYREDNRLHHVDL